MFCHTEGSAACFTPAIRTLADAGIVQPSLFDDQDLAEIHSPEYPGERLIACRNPLLAAGRTRKREGLLQASEKEMAKHFHLASL